MTRLLGGFFTVGGWTLASRILGFVRDIAIAALLGAGPVAEAFLIAFSLPNMFRRFFGEGAFNTAFVPMFARRVEAGEDAQGFARDAFAGLTTILIAFTVLALFAMPWLVLAMASGFGGDERFDLAVLYGRIAFPYILFISLAALLSGVLNAVGRFAAAAAAPVLLNILFIGALVGAWHAGRDIGLTLAWTVPVAGIAQLALVWVAADRAGVRIRPAIPRWTPELKQLAIIAAPAALAGGVVQINLLVGRQVASFFDGAVAWLNYADRLYQLPLGVVGIAVGIVLLPELARRLTAKDTAAARDAYSGAMEFALALTLPGAVALGVIAVPLISVLFERGAFGAADTQATALALIIYAFGLPAFVAQKVLQPHFFARSDTKTPFRYALVSMVVNAAVAIGLAPAIGFTAAALGTTLAAWAMTWLLWRGSRRFGETARLTEGAKRRIPRLAAASVVMGVALAVLAPWLTNGIALGGLASAASLAALVLAGALVFAAAALGLRAIDPALIRQAVRRGG